MERPAWRGVILRRWTRPSRDYWSMRPTQQYYIPEFCTVRVPKRREAYELPKAGARWHDTSPFATARRALWEEAGVWLGWRDPGTFAWVDSEGELLHNAEPWISSWVLADLSWDGDMCERVSHHWLALDEFLDLSNRDDHAKVLTRTMHRQLW